MILDFNKIYVIESLPDKQDKTGTDLHDDIIRRRLWSKEEMTSELCIINSKVDFYLLLSRIEYETDNIGVIPYLHFEIHGNPDGFYLNSNEQVNWYELRNRLTHINILSRNRLWISLATCFGAFIYTTYSLIDRAPFYGYVGAWTELDVRDILSSYERYFEILLDDFDVYKAVEALNLSNPNKQVEYKLYNSKDVFQKTYDNYEKETYTKDGIRRRQEQIAKLGLQSPKNDKAKYSKEFFMEYAKKTLLAERRNFRKRFYRQFLMIDIYPEVEDRFK